MNDFSFISEKYQLVLEKDHRQKMIKFGIPEKIADYLHEFSNKYSIWFANQIKDMDGYKEASAGEKLFWIRRNLEDDMRGIVDWISNSANISIKDYDWASAVEAQEEYHDNLESTDISGEDNEILKKYEGGYYWVDLETNRCQEEGSAMGHCGSTTADTLFSLRQYDKKTNKISAKVTIAVSPDENEWKQAKGKFNNKPDGEYEQFIADILVLHDVYKYSPEYGSQEDFNVQDLTDTIEADRDYFDGEYGEESMDEFLENIEENTIDFDDFQEKLEKYTLNHFYVYIDEDEHIYGNVGCSFEVDIDDDVFGKYVGNVQDHFNKFKEDDSDSKEFCEHMLGSNYPSMYEGIEYARVELDEDRTSLSIGFDVGSVHYNVDAGGLESFGSDMDDIFSEDQNIDQDDLNERFLKYLYDNDVVPDPEYEYDDEIKPRERYNKYQQEFNFTYDSYNISRFEDLCKLV